MSSLFKKRNFRDHRGFLVLNGPESFEAELQLLEDIEVFRKTKSGREICFAIYFVTTLKGLATASKKTCTSIGRPSDLVCLSERNVEEVRLRIQPR